MSAEAHSVPGNGVLVMAGGTGGHIFPGLAVAQALRTGGMSVTWLGASGGMETEKVPVHDIELDTIHISGLRGKGMLGWLGLPLRLTRAVLEAGRVLDARKPACAVSFGGYVAGPGGIAAWLRGVPLVVHEQNRIPGLTNKTLARIARQVMQAFPDTFPPRFKAQTCGNPVRRELSDLPHPAERWTQRNGPMRLLVTGGSQGARALNNLLPEALAMLSADIQLHVRHQSGRQAVAPTAESYRNHGLDAEVTAFVEDMATAYAWADLVVCRSGALTVSELAAVGLGAVLVPFPHAVDDHQTANAEVLVSIGAAVLQAEPGLDARQLADCLESLLGDRQKCLRMAEAARTVASPDAAQAVADVCHQWVRS